MPSDLNQIEIELFRNDSNQLILEIQGLIDIIINQFFQSEKLNLTERHEIKQLINEKLLHKVPQIQKQFQGKSLFRTYLSAVIRNICRDILRTRTKTQYVTYDDISIGSDDNIVNDLLIEEEVIRLQKILGLYHKQKTKLILCLKFIFRMPFDIQDFRAVFDNFEMKEFDTFVKQVHPYKECTDMIIFVALTPIFNKHENKNNGPDAIRKWVKQKITELIDILNERPSSSRYTEETFQILFEKCFFNEKDVMSKIF